MCTLSFIARKRGYVVAMNRDERLARPGARAPRVFRFGGRRALYPSERTGGAWIAANDSGIILALLNRNARPGLVQTRSRGGVIPKLIGTHSAVQLRARFARLDLRGMLPFRLIAFCPRERVVLEWSWNGKKTRAARRPWATRHWFSSGLSDRKATHFRGGTCRAAWREPGAGSATWLRRLHRSHAPQRGPFSVCAHREEAGTVSYTEIAVTPSRLAMRYRPGPPCAPARFRALPLLLQPLP